MVKLLITNNIIKQKGQNKNNNRLMTVLTCITPNEPMAKNNSKNLLPKPKGKNGRKGEGRRKGGGMEEGRG